MLMLHHIQMAQSGHSCLPTQQSTVQHLSTSLTCTTLLSNVNYGLHAQHKKHKVNKTTHQDTKLTTQTDLLTSTCSFHVSILYASSGCRCNMRPTWLIACPNPLYPPQPTLKHQCMTLQTLNMDQNADPSFKLCATYKAAWTTSHCILCNKGH